jgi:HEAT repeat protein
VRLAWIVCTAAACGPTAGSARAPRLQPPAVIDPSRPDATYLTSVALQLQPGWGQFLDDCRDRLAADHPLNQSTLAATALLTLDREGTLVAVAMVTGSGNRDFDRAVTDVVAESTFGAPPLDALSDDDRVYLHWLFARDRRQAGPVTAVIEHRELPLGEAIARFIAEKDLARAARRIASATQGDRAAAMTATMIAALREGLTSVDGSVQRAAVDAVAATHTAALAPDLRGLIDSADKDLAVAAIAAVGELRDPAAGDALAHRLPNDLTEQRQLALAEAATLVRLGRTSEVSAAIGKALPNPIALEAFARAPVEAALDKVRAALAHGSPSARGAACAGLAGVTFPAAVTALGGGLGDADASVRAACLAAVFEAPPAVVARLAPRVVALQRDHDRGVRANAVIATSLLDPAHLAHAVDDPASEVRAAYARALEHAEGWQAGLHTLIEDRDAGVRAAAWHAYVIRGVPAEVPPSLGDPSAEVRLAAVPAARDTEVLGRLAHSDEAPAVRSAALVELAHRMDRGALLTLLLQEFPLAQPATADRVRMARAWLLAP